MCFGPFARLYHWGPLTALAIIKLVTGMTVHCSSMIWPTDTPGGLVNIFGFMALSGLSIYNFLAAAFHGPGFLPHKWTPEKEDDISELQYCGVCQGYKAPRAHHCRKCGRCTLKMDHHCPWINNCVGWGNHAHFTYFLLFSVLGCMHATVILSACMYRGFYRIWYMYYTPNIPQVQFSISSVVICIFSLGLAIGVVFAVGMLLFFQLRSIGRNRTGVEEWIYDKAVRRRQNTEKVFKFPYDLGIYQNIKQVVNLSGNPIGDGITWKVAEGCDQYTLTREQLAQKAEKKQRAKMYQIIQPASGYWFPISKGLYVLMSSPCTEDPRIKLEIDDTVLVTRWNKHWLFGEKMQPNIPESEKALNRVRGWFPRKCAVQMIEPTSPSPKHSKKRN
ncbi:PREDICTED: palmitoyltransferase ZDHHC6 [Nicrophorus vespilloides]|uniref:Palmitoyltransferase n=1 Tax=Nicrophorus vespilloides TaxID=110193 RepID=A0ABM1MYS9_NICVS|nr:PREDICTED: palmitoyltransferase ZDHHC6 [Nicrophorus vespilloides]